MIHKLKALALSLAAVLAMSAIAASAAQAVPTFTAESYPAHIDSTIETSITINSQGRATHCSSVTFTADMAAASTTLTITPAFGNSCTTTVLGKSFPTTITMNGCDFLLHTTNPSGPNPYFATVDLACSPPADIVIHLYETAAKHNSNEPTCTFTIESKPAGIPPINVSLDHFTLTNGTNAITGKTDITAKATVEKIRNIVTGNEATCGTTNTTTKFEGATTLSGTTSSGANQGISVSG